MPRPRDPAKQRARARTERWRASRRAAGRPEASIIDRAIAASMAVFLTEALQADPSAPQPTLRDITAGAQRILVAAGYERQAANAELKRRLTRRNDLKRLSAITLPVTAGDNGKPSSPPVTPKKRIRNFERGSDRPLGLTLVSAGEQS